LLQLVSVDELHAVCAIPYPEALKHTEVSSVPYLATSPVRAGCLHVTVTRTCGLCKDVNEKISVSHNLVLQGEIKDTDPIDNLENETVAKDNTRLVCDACGQISAILTFKDEVSFETRPKYLIFTTRSSAPLNTLPAVLKSNPQYYLSGAILHNAHYGHYVYMAVNETGRPKADDPLTVIINDEDVSTPKTLSWVEKTNRSKSKKERMLWRVAVYAFLPALKAGLSIMKKNIAEEPGVSDSADEDADAPSTPSPAHSPTHKKRKMTSVSSDDSMYDSDDDRLVLDMPALRDIPASDESGHTDDTESDEAPIRKAKAKHTSKDKGIKKAVNQEKGNNKPVKKGNKGKGNKKLVKGPNK
jgi:hypothetical protein